MLEGSNNLDSMGEDGEEEVVVGYGRIDAILVKVMAASLAFLVSYCAGAIWISGELQAKTTDVKAEITKANRVITTAKDDATYLKGVSDDYVEVTNKLSAILVKINQNSITQQNDFDIPNFLSELMFIMPSGVKVTSIDV